MPLAGPHRHSDQGAPQDLNAGMPGCRGVGGDTWRLGAGHQQVGRPRPRGRDTLWLTLQAWSRFTPQTKSRPDRRVQLRMSIDKRP